MQVIVFSADTAVSKALGALRRSTKARVQLESRDDARSWLRSVSTGESYDSADTDLIYLDVSGLAQSERTRLLRYAIRRGVAPVGILDPYDELDDPAAWIREGAVDYVGSALLASDLKVTRLHAVNEWSRELGDRVGSTNEPARTGSTLANAAESTSSIPAQSAGVTGVRVEPRFIDDADPDFPRDPIELVSLHPSPADWTRVRVGTEYTFATLYIGLDLGPNVTKDASTEFVTRSISEFQQALAETAAPYGGRLWFWKGHAGVILFPFDGLSGNSIIAALRIVLSRVFWQAEGRTNYVTKYFRLALHVGNVEYQVGHQRETLVSDHMNYLFHLGTEYAADGDFIATREIISRCPPGLRRCFRRFGSYGGREIWRMRPVRTPAANALGSVSKIMDER